MTIGGKRILFAAVSVIGGLCSGAEPTGESGIAIRSEKLNHFLENHCVSCHGPDKQKAKFRVDTLPGEITDGDVALHWQDVLDVLNSGEMPPEDEDQPTQDELEGAIADLTEGLFRARKRLAGTGGKVVMRHLNRREYAATIKHLFGFEPELAMIPSDDEVVNFDTVGARQAFSTERFDAYYELGQKVVAAGFKWSGIREESKSDVQQPEHWTKRYRGDVERWKDGKGKVVRLSRIRQEYLALPMVESGAYLSEPLRALAYNRGVDPRGRYKIRVRAGIHGEMTPVRRFIRVQAGNAVEVFRIDGTPENPSESVVEVQPPLTPNGRLGGRVQEDRRGAWLSQYLTMLKHAEGIEPTDGLIWIDSIAVEGPFYPEARSFFDELLYPEAPQVGKRSTLVWKDESARELIQRFAVEAFRRKKPSADYVDGLHAYFLKQRQKERSFNDSMIDTLAIVLASPAFLYLNEDTGASEGSRTLSSRDVATRLSYFLTSGPPDEALYATAEASSPGLAEARTKEDLPAGALRSEPRRGLDYLQAQIDRLLLGPNGHRFAEGFASQWADFVRMDSISVPDKKYPTYAEGLRHSMKREVVAYFQEMIRENLPVSSLVRSDFAVVNAQLATHYGIPGVTTNEFVRVSLKPGSPRGGYVSQAAFHVAGSNGERTSPVVRGMLLMNRFLHSEPAPPPPNVPELGTGVKGAVTTKKLVELHQSQAQCASCHRKMDAIGLALENFDVIGRWRTEEKVYGRTREPVVIDGKLPGGEAFSDFKQFQSALMAHEADLARSMVESLLTYALGRDVEFTDEPHVDAILEKIRPNGYRMRDMIHAIAESPVFSLN